jgi:thiol-disulfide isomerase/thioredoxin
MKMLTAAVTAGFLAFALGARPASAQHQGVSIATIDADYERELDRLDRQRLDRLGKLAQSQPPEQAEATYSAYFSMAIAKGLYREAEPVAVSVIKAAQASPGIVGMAYLVKITGEADRGKFEESLRSLSDAIRVAPKDAKPTDASPAADSLSIGVKASILDAYYQRLVRDDQVEIARRAMRLIAENAKAPALRDLAASRLKQLDMIGAPAPAFTGTDPEGKPIALADSKGDVVLLVFWASWCVPNAQEIPWLDAIQRKYGGQGFRIVGVNLDVNPSTGHDLKTAWPSIRRFLIDYNVTWPNVINGEGDKDVAKAYGVREIPASVLIGRDGEVIHLDLRGTRLEAAVAKAVAQPK